MFRRPKQIHHAINIPCESAIVLIINLIIGLGIFLFGMIQLEKSIEALSSRFIKRWLAQSTGHPISSVLTGTAITAFVQSSSMVSLGGIGLCECGNHAIV